MLLGPAVEFALNLADQQAGPGFQPPQTMGTMAGWIYMEVSTNGGTPKAGRFVSWQILFT